MKLWTSAIAAVAVASVVSGCALTVNLDPGPEANSASCANMTVRLPETLAGEARRSVNAQAAGAWGEPVSIIVRCGIPLPSPNPLPCFEIDGIDWLRDDAEAPRFIFTTYGLDPATEVIVDSERVSGTEVLFELSRAVGSQSTPVQACIDVTDVRG